MLLIYLSFVCRREGQIICDWLNYFTYIVFSTLCLTMLSNHVFPLCNEPDWLTDWFVIQELSKWVVFHFFFFFVHVHIITTRYWWRYGCIMKPDCWKCWELPITANITSQNQVFNAAWWFEYWVIKQIYEWTQLCDELLSLFSSSVWFLAVWIFIVLSARY